MKNRQLSSDTCAHLAFFRKAEVMQCRVVDFKITYIHTWWQIITYIAMHFMMYATCIFLFIPTRFWEYRKPNHPFTHHWLSNSQRIWANTHAIFPNGVRIFPNGVRIREDAGAIQEKCLSHTRQCMFKLKNTSGLHDIACC